MNSIPRRWLLHGLHALLALGLPFLLLALTSCMKATAKKEDLGPAIPETTINAALLWASQGTTLNALTIGQYATYATVRRVENGDVGITLDGSTVEVIDRQDTSTQARFTMLITDSQVQPDGSFLTTTSEDALWLDKSGTGSTTSANLNLSPQPSPLSAQAVVQSVLKSLDTTGDSTQPVTYYNLSQYTDTFAVPAVAAARTNCSGLAPCQLNLRYVQFDMALWQDSTNYQKITIDLGFAANMPLIPYGQDLFTQMSGALVVYCRSMYVMVDSNSVYVNDCQTLQDFQK